MALTFTKNLANHLSLGVGALGPHLNGASTILFVSQVRGSSFDTSAGDNQIIATYIDASQLGVGLNVGNATPVARGAAKSQSGESLQSRVANTTVSTGNWHILSSFTNIPNDSIHLYLDGALDSDPVGAVTFTGSAYTAGTPIPADRIGRTNNEQINQQFAGDIEHISIWRDINQTQAADINSSLQSGAKPYDVTPAPVVCLVLGYATPDVCVMGSGVTSTITGSLPFVEGPTGLPPTADHRRLIIGGLYHSGSSDGTATTQDPDYESTIQQASTSQGVGANATAFIGHRIITLEETQDYQPIIDPARLWIAGIAAYKADVDGGTSTPEPTISSSLTAETTEGAEFFYQIDATNGAFLYSASPLPTGLVADTGLGHITGTVGAGTADTYNIILGATNDSGVGNATLVLTVHPAQPAPPGGVFKHKPLPMAIVATLGNIYHAPSSKL